jgi:polyphenol oxidase
VHSNEVVIAEKPRLRGEPHVQADAIVTDKPTVALLMQFADCVPILFYDPERKVIASAHAGWKGTLNGIAAETINVMVKMFKSEPKNIISVIGPSICRDHYQIGDDVASKVRSVFKPEENVLSYIKDKIFMDLSAANKSIIEKRGLINIEMMEICTFCNKEDWFTHRGESGKTGRFASVITF